MTAAKVKVVDRYAVYDGTKQRGGSEVLDVAPDLAERWLARGWVEPVAEKSPQPSKRSPRKTRRRT